MSAASFVLVMTGVLLNAAAQLLLKAGTNSVGTFAFSLENAVPVGWKLATEPHIVGGLACYVVSVVVWIMALSRRGGEHRLSDALGGLRRQRDRGVVPVRRSGVGDAARGHRHHHPRRVHRRAQLMHASTETPAAFTAADAVSYLPFTRPAIDEETIAGVADVLRSGWITSGPQVKQFEAELSALFRRASRARPHLRHRRAGARAAHRRHRCRATK